MERTRMAKEETNLYTIYTTEKIKLVNIRWNALRLKLHIFYSSGHKWNKSRDDKWNKSRDDMHMKVCMQYWTTFWFIVIQVCNIGPLSGLSWYKYAILDHLLI